MSTFRIVAFEKPVLWRHKKVSVFKVYPFLTAIVGRFASILLVFSGDFVKTFLDAPSNIPCSVRVLLHCELLCNLFFFLLRFCSVAAFLVVRLEMSSERLFLFLPEFLETDRTRVCL